MDINQLRSIVTVLSALVFAGIVVWAWRRTNTERFDEAAMLPFSDAAADAETEAVASTAAQTQGEIRP